MSAPAGLGRAGYRCGHEYSPRADGAPAWPAAAWGAWSAWARRSGHGRRPGRRLGGPGRGDWPASR